jgi:medium-chain acyl-[acyl-carrier-protein] hydrolase
MNGSLLVGRTPWLVRLAGNSYAPLRIFAFPFAGGSATAYAPWRDWLVPEVELFGVQLPGRSVRFHEPPISDMSELIDALVPSLLPMLDRPFVLFGHSNGALMSFALLERLQRMRQPLPSGIILSGKACPDVSHRPKLYSQLPDDAFLKRIESLGGTPRELLDSPDLMRLFLPILRADFVLGERYCLPSVDASLGNVRTLILAGEEDDTAVEDVFAWKKVFPEARTVCMRGGHFFIDTDPTFCATINGFCGAGMLDRDHHRSWVRLRLNQ